MNKHIVHSSDPITLIGGGKATIADLQKALTLAPICIAADGGAALASRANVALDAVIGDFDSIEADILAQIPAAQQHHITDQSNTDFEKALSAISAPVVIGVGFTGGRVDHQLAAFHTLHTFAARPCVLLAEDEVIFLAPPDIALPCDPGDVISLYPMAPVTGRSTGLAWPIDGLNFAPGVFNGTSNRATGPITVALDGPDMLMIAPRRLIQPVVSQLMRPVRARWSARAG